MRVEPNPELSLRDFIKLAPDKVVDEFVRLFCSGSRNQLYQLTGNHRRMSTDRAKAVSRWAKLRGYNVPRRKLRPDVWDDLPNHGARATKSKKVLRRNTRSRS